MEWKVAVSSNGCRGEWVVDGCFVRKMGLLCVLVGNSGIVVVMEECS